MPFWQKQQKFNTRNLLKFIYLTQVTLSYIYRCVVALATDGVKVFCAHKTPPLGSPDVWSPSIIPTPSPQAQDMPPGAVGLESDQPQASLSSKSHIVSDVRENNK